MKRTPKKQQQKQQQQQRNPVPPPPSKPRQDFEENLNLMKSRKVKMKEVGAACLLAFLAIAVYGNSLEGEFVHDDIVSIVRNQDVRASTPWTQLWKNDYWGTPMASHLSHKSYRPLTVLTFRMNFIMGRGVSAFWFHVTNIGIHAMVCVLVFFICSHVLALTTLSSLTASTMFALHPIHTEAVAGITGRSDALSGFLMLVSFLLYAKSLGKANAAANGLNWGIIWSGVVGCAAMLAKETGITVLAINTFYDLYLHMDLVKSWLTNKSGDQRQIHLRRRIIYTITLISISLGLRLALMNGSFPRFSQQDNPAAHSTSEMTRFLTFAFLPVFNVWLMLCPYNLKYDWQMGSIPLVESLWDLRNLSTGIFYPVSLWLLLQCFAKGKESSRRQSRTVVFVALLFISLPFLPASNLLFPVGFVAAERILYTPSIGVCILTVHGIDLIRRNFPVWRTVLVPFLCLMLMSFTVKTWDRNTVWKSRASLFESGLRENPQNAKVHFNYANLQKDLGHIAAAVNHYKIAIRLWPEYASAYNNLGALSEDPITAQNCFLRAIHVNPQHNGAHFNLAVIYMRDERHEEALEHLEECLKLDPSHVEALQYLGACYNVLNRSHEAENVFHKLINSDLPPSELHSNFASFLQELGRNSEALTHYLLALSKASWNIQALVEGAKLASKLGSHQLFEQLSHQLLSIEFDSGVAYTLAINYMEKGQVSEATPLFERLVEESNSFYKIHYGQFLIDVRRWSEAEETLRSIPPGDSDHPTAQLLLATVYENQNRTTEAFDTLECAMETFCPQETNLCAQIYSQMGNLMHTMGAFDSAAQNYDMAIKFNPSSVQAHSNIGAIYHLMREYKQAYTHYVAALELEPTNPVVLSNIQKLQRVQSDYEQHKSHGNEFSFA